MFPGAMRFLELEFILVAKQLENHLVCKSCKQFGSASREHRNVDYCAEAVVWLSGHQVRTSSPTSSWKSPAGFDFNTVNSACLNLLSKNPLTGSWLRCLRRTGVIMCLQLLGILLLLIENLSGIPPRRFGKAVPRLRNVAKKSAEMAAKVEQARNARATAEQNRCLCRAGRGACSSSKQQGRQWSRGKWARSTAWSSSCPRTPTKKPTTTGNNTVNWRRGCHNLRGEMGAKEAKRTKVHLESLEAAAKTAKAAEEAEGRRAFDQCADDEEILSSEHDPCCISFLFANVTCWGALAEKVIVHQRHDYHVGSFAESHLIRERNSCVDMFSSEPREEVFLCRCGHHRASL